MNGKHIMSRRLASEHGIVCRLPGEQFGYFGWPTVARQADGRLVVASSGLRTGHICPFGKTVLNTSTDDGRTWSAPRVIQDSMIDDRDAGVLAWGTANLLVTWFRSDTRMYRDATWIPAAERETWDALFAQWTDAQVQELVGSWLMLSADGGRTWSAPIRVPVSTPHGPDVAAAGNKETRRIT
jgi:Neuraminidase (sialidase)